MNSKVFKFLCKEKPHFILLKTTKAQNKTTENRREAESNFKNLSDYGIGNTPIMIHECDKKLEYDELDRREELIHYKDDIQNQSL